jgi:hypothetical protein
MRKFNVYSPLVVVVPNENFDWVLNSAEAASVTVQPVNNWPLSQNSYSVTAGTPVQATVSATAVKGTCFFSCTPAAPNVATQQIVVAALHFVNPCSDVSVMPGDYFVWKNDNASGVTIVPDPNNPNFWPIGDQHHYIEAAGHHAVQVPANAAAGSYTLLVTFDGGGGCTAATQPKIIVGGSGVAGS